MRAVLGAALLAVLAGCARQPPPAVPVSPRPVSEVTAAPEDRTNETPADASETLAGRALDAVRTMIARPDDAPDAEDDEAAPFSPEAIHRARIALAKEALVEENAMKQRLDVEEQLQRELEELEDRAAKSRR